MKYSLIVPLYNRQDTIRACLDSLLVQEEQDYEIIIVNDGSTDTSGEIADEYASKFNNVKVIHKENGGLSSARNAGIEVACGNYLLFPDSDDEYKPNLLSYLNEFYGADIICFGYEVIYQTVTEQKQITLENISTKNCSKQEMLIILEEKGVFNVAWNKAYKRELFQDLRFGQEKTAEDVIFNCRYFLKVESIAILKDMLYRYIRKEDVSLATKYNPDLLSVISVVNLERLNLYKYYQIENQENVKVMFAKKFVNYYFSVVPNIYRKNNGLKCKQKYKQLKELIKNKELKSQLKIAKSSGFNLKTFSFFVKLNNGVIAHIFYSFLFFIRNNFTGLYKKLRRK